MCYAFQFSNTSSISFETFVWSPLRERGKSTLYARMAAAQGCAEASSPEHSKQQLAREERGIKPSMPDQRWQLS